MWTHRNGLHQLISTVFHYFLFYLLKLQGGQSQLETGKNEIYGDLKIQYHVT